MLFFMISSTGAQLQSPNPDTFLNHLSPQEAYEYEVTRNVLLALLGVSYLCLLSRVPSTSTHF
jgi:hypothetical protein